MNHLCARELSDADGKPTGRWYYTSANDRGGAHAIGYCSPFELCPAKCVFGHVPGSPPPGAGSPKCTTCGGKGIVSKADPCPGHATPEEAAEHYRQYLLDNAKITGPKQQEWPKYKCAVDGCNNEGRWLASVDAYKCYELCKDHANREALAALVRVGESWQS